MNAKELQKGVRIVKDKYDGRVVGSVKRTFECNKGRRGEQHPGGRFHPRFLCNRLPCRGFSSASTPSNLGLEIRRRITQIREEILPQYDPVDVYNHIRCRLAHNYTIGGNVALTHLHPELHDPKPIKGRKGN